MAEASAAYAKMKDQPRAKVTTNRDTINGDLICHKFRYVRILEYTLYPEQDKVRHIEATEKFWHDLLVGGIAVAAGAIGLLPGAPIVAGSVLTTTAVAGTVAGAVFTFAPSRGTYMKDLDNQEKQLMPDKVYYVRSLLKIFLTEEVDNREIYFRPDSEKSGNGMIVWSGEEIKSRADALEIWAGHFGETKFHKDIIEEEYRVRSTKNFHRLRESIEVECVKHVKSNYPIMFKADSGLLGSTYRPISEHLDPIIETGIGSDIVNEKYQNVLKRDVQYNNKPTRGGVLFNVGKFTDSKYEPEPSAPIQYRMF